MDNIFQIFEYIGIPFGYLFQFIYGLTGHYLTALLVFSVIIKLAMLPLNIRQQESMVGRAKLAPQEKAIRDKYKNKTDEKSAAEMNKQIMELYSQNGQSLAGGCFPLLIQMPILFSLYAIITKPLTYISGLDAASITSLETRVHEVMQINGNLTQIQVISYVKENLSAFADLLGGIALPEFTVLGGTIDLSRTPSITNLSWLLLVPVLTLLASYLTTFIRQKLNPVEAVGAENEIGRSMKTMQYIMPLMSVWISFSVPAIIGVYWILQSILDVLQQFILYKLCPISQPEKEQSEKESTTCSK